RDGDPRDRSSAGGIQRGGAARLRAPLRRPWASARSADPGRAGRRAPGMGNDVTAPTGSAALVPELGPALGRLSARPRSADGRWVRLDALRLELATRILELGGAARAFAAADDRAAAVSALTRQAWLVEWERAVAEATERIVQAVNARLDAAAVEARLPQRRRHGLPLSEPDRRAI